MSSGERLQVHEAATQVLFESYRKIDGLGQLKRKGFVTMSYRYDDGRSDIYYYGESNYVLARDTAIFCARVKGIPFTQVNRTTIEECLNAKAAEEEYDQIKNISES
jgi:hypothetical protein